MNHSHVLNVGIDWSSVNVGIASNVVSPVAITTSSVMSSLSKEVDVSPCVSILDFLLITIVMSRLLIRIPCGFGRAPLQTLGLLCYPFGP